MSERRWVYETLHEGVRVGFAVDRTLHEEATPHQRLELIENSVFGRVLLLDGAVQVTTADEFIYHEMMSHVPLIAHGAARKVLIVGGGDCGLAEEVLKHPGVESVLQIEIDPSVVAFSREHFAAFNAPVFDDARFRVEIADGAAFVAGTEQRFDVILVDSTDPIGPGAVLFTEEFYRSLRRCLNPGGVVVTQNSVPFLQRKEFVAGMGALTRAFPCATAYVVAVPTYFGGHMTLGWASETRDALDAPLEALKTRAAELATRYYTPEVHRAAFALPRYIADALAEAQAG